MSDDEGREAHEREHELPQEGQPLELTTEPVPEDVLATPSEGLEARPQAGKRVIVMGGGISGLVAAYELQRQGHDPVVLEAQHRVGGRVYTLRDLFAPGLYAEAAGAMRIPRVHELTLAYCQEFGLPLRPFVMGNPKSFVYLSGHPKSFVYLSGQRMTMEEANAHPERLPFELAEHERERTCQELWDEGTREVRELYQREGERALDLIVEEYDRYSIRQFLEHRGFSEGAIELYGVMSFREANMEAAVIEQLREIVGRAFEDMQEIVGGIVGGMDRLPTAFFAHLKDRVRFGAEIRALEQGRDSVTVHYRTPAGRFSVRADYAVCALPFSVLADIEVTPQLSAGKRKAIRELNYTTPRRSVPDAEPVLGAEPRHRGRDHHDRAPHPAHRLSLLLRPPGGARRAPGQLHVGAGRRPVGGHAAGGPDRGGVGERGSDPPRDRGGVRGRRVTRVVRGPLGPRSFRALRAASGDAVAVRHRPAGGPCLLRGVALLPLARLDPGGAGVGDQGGQGGPRGGGVARSRLTHSRKRAPQAPSFSVPVEPSGSRAPAPRAAPG